MANFQLNRTVKLKQLRTFLYAGGAILTVIVIMATLMAGNKPKAHAKNKEPLDITGIINESFSQANADSAITAQQTEVEALKGQVSKLTQYLKEISNKHEKELEGLSERMSSELKALAELKQAQITSVNTAQVSENKNGMEQGLWNNSQDPTIGARAPINLALSAPNIHTVSFRQKPKKRIRNYLNPEHYVPSNTSVRAVILGGADADASVNGQSKNNGIMLFKFLENGTLPNGRRSRLSGCRVSANSYGDISSERAFATLYRLSCARKGHPIIDKEVTGWVFYNGKVGIKGKPLMRDGKVMQWAGLGGMISSGASIAQSAQSVQQFSPLGATSFVPSANLVPYAALGGAAKTGDSLSQYYIQRAEQYHPVIQVGSNNEVTIVFKDGFYLEPDEEHQKHQRPYGPPKVRRTASRLVEAEAPIENSNFNVPEEVLGRIDTAYNQNPSTQGVRP